MKLNNISISIKLAAIILIALVTAIFLVILEIEPEINITHNDFLMVSTDICNNITHAAQETGELSEDLINQYISDMKYALNIRIVDTNWTVLFDSTSHNKNSEQALDINDITNMLNTRKPYSAVLPIRVENKTLGYLLTELQASELQISQPLYNTLLPLRIIIAIVVFFLLVYLATSSIRRRFNALLQTIQRFASGDYLYSFHNVQPEDELGELNAVLNDMAQKLTDARNKELKMEEAKNELIAGVSHDLKNPLTSILGYTQILKESGPEALNNSAHYLDIIESKALQLKTMVEELFTYTKLNTGDIPLKRSRLNLVDIVRQIASEFETYFSQTGKTLTLILPKNPVFAEVDGDLISRP